MRAIILATAVLAAACGQSAAQGEKSAAGVTPEAAATAATAAEVSPSSGLVDAILAAVPATPGAIDPASIRTRVTSVTWRPRPEGALVAQGTLGDVEAQVMRTPPSFGLMWGAEGAPIPYDVVAELRARGATVNMVGCMALGAGENNEVYAVTAQGHAPFGLTVYGRMAPTASAQSFYNVSVDLTGRPPTRASLGSDYAATC